MESSRFEDTNDTMEKVNLACTHRLFLKRLALFVLWQKIEWSVWKNFEKIVVMPIFRFCILFAAETTWKFSCNQKYVESL